MADAICSVEGCGRAPWTKDLCLSHYNRLRRTGSVSAGEPIRQRGQRTKGPVGQACSVADCGRPAKTKGLCPTHYQRLQRTGSVQAEIPIRIDYSSVCTLSGCSEPHYLSGLCRAHYKSEKRREPCKVDHCSNPREARGLCMNHYQQWRRGGGKTRTFNELAPTTEEEGRTRKCAIPDCASIYIQGRDLCATHYRYWHERTVRAQVRIRAAVEQLGGDAVLFEDVEIARFEQRESIAAFLESLCSEGRRAGVRNCAQCGGPISSNRRNARYCAKPGCKRAYAREYEAERRTRHDRVREPVPQPGQPGLPPLGALIDDGERVQCHVCGRWYKRLTMHIRTHGLDDDAYRERYELPRTTALVSPAVSARLRDNAIALNIGAMGRANLAAHGSPGRTKGTPARLGERIGKSEIQRRRQAATD